jgi:hypothetical protein
VTLPAFSLSAALNGLERILLTLWVGGLWVTGLVHAPVLFATFPRIVAGEIAGRLFSAMSLVGMICAVSLLVLAVARLRRVVLRDWRAHVVLIMLLITIMGEFGIATRLREMREVIAHHPAADLMAQFGRLHAIASGIYLVEVVLGLLLVVAGSRTRAQAGS